MKKISLLLLFLISLSYLFAQTGEKIRFGSVVLTEQSENNYISESINNEGNAKIKMENLNEFIQSKGYKFIGSDSKSKVEENSHFKHIYDSFICTYENNEKAKRIILKQKKCVNIVKADGFIHSKDEILTPKYYIYLEIEKMGQMKNADI